MHWCDSCVLGKERSHSQQQQQHELYRCRLRIRTVFAFLTPTRRGSAIARRWTTAAAAAVDDARKCSARVAAGAAEARLHVGTLTPCAAIFIGQRAQGCSQLAARAAAATVKSLARGHSVFTRI